MGIDIALQIPVFLLRKIVSDLKQVVRFARVTDEKTANPKPWGGEDGSINISIRKVSTATRRNQQLCLQ